MPLPLPPVTPAYITPKGAAFIGDSVELLKGMPAGSVNLVMTSPPFALLRQKTYGNVEETEYVEWFLNFGREVHRVLKEDGSFVIDMGGAYRRGVPSRSLYQFRTLIALCDDVGFHLAQDFYWNNPSKLPSPIEWVNKRKMRAKDAVNNVWWLSKTAFPKADVSRVLAPYSDRMKKLLQDPEAFYKPGTRPSGHAIGAGFGKDNGGAIPPNVITLPNTESNGVYDTRCALVGVPRHPARFPAGLPQFFVKMLTDPGDTILDIFGGSNVTGMVAEQEERQWLSFEREVEYVAASVFRFLPADLSQDTIRSAFASVRAGESVDTSRLFRQLPLLPTG